MSRRIDPIHDAVLRGDVAALEAALAEGGDTNSRIDGGRTPLINAVIEGQTSIIEALVKSGADVNASDSLGFTALHHAALRQSADIIKVLIASGALVDAKDSFGNTPLFRAVFESRGRKEAILELLAAGADQNAKNNSDVSPLDLAKTIANFDVLSALSIS